MEYFLSHIPHILVMGLIIGGLAAIFAFGGIYNAKHRDFNLENCDYKCETCGNYSICNKDGKKKILK